MINFKTITLFVSVLFLSACSTHNFNALRQGMTADKVADYTVGAPKNQYSGVQAQANDYSIAQYKRGSSKYYLIYKSKKLVFWGYVYEVARQADPAFSILLDNIQAIE